MDLTGLLLGLVAIRKALTVLWEWSSAAKRNIVAADGSGSIHEMTATCSRVLGTLVVALGAAACGRVSFDRIPVPADSGIDAAACTVSAVPAIDLAFAGATSLDPRITFTRASVGSYVGEGGLIRFAPADTPRLEHDPDLTADDGASSQANVASAPDVREEVTA